MEITYHLGAEVAGITIVNSLFGQNKGQTNLKMPSHHKAPTPCIACTTDVKPREPDKTSAMDDGKIVEPRPGSPPVPGDEPQDKRAPFAQAVYDMTHSEKVMAELTLGRRVGLYELRGEIGSGNFAKVKMGVHTLTRGKGHVRAKE